MSQRTKCLVGVCLAVVLALGYASGILAGPLSDQEVIKRLAGVVTSAQTLACTATPASAASASSAIPPGSMVRLLATGGNLFFGFMAASATPSVTNSPQLAANSDLIIQNGTGIYPNCVTASGVSASLNVSILQ